MIFFRPSTDAESSSSVKFEAIEDEFIYGSCQLRIEGNKATVFHLNFDAEKPYIVEGLLRSAFNYAALKNCYMGHCSCDNIIPFLEKMNFQKSDTEFFNDIPSILTGGCCKK